MKTIIFNLNSNNRISALDFQNRQWRYEYKIDILPAYAISYIVISLNGLLSYDCVTIENDIIKFENHYEISEQESLHLIIYYKGIRDYALLFPAILSANQSLALRLGLFYEEAEKSFENSAWLSYVLNCGAIFEGLLFHKLNTNATFNCLINTALERNFINTETAKIMHNTRDKRNLVHAGKYMDPFITRLEAMDVMKVMDNVIINFR